MELFRSLAFFLAAGLCEIGGGYLVWIWLRGSLPPPVCALACWLAKPVRSIWKAREEATRYATHCFTRRRVVSRISHVLVPYDCS
jgi:small multidrug resistance family-3 protein